MNRLLACSLLFLLITALSFGDPVSTGGSYSLLHGGNGGGGGRAAGTTVTAELSSGISMDGGASDTTPGGVHTKGGFTGQLYDAAGIDLSAIPSASVEEGNPVGLVARLLHDDGTVGETIQPNWSINDGPVVSITPDGFAFAGNTPTTATSMIEANFGGFTSQIRLNVVPVSYAPHPMIWEDPNLNGPYFLYVGDSPDTLAYIGSPTLPHFNPGQLDMGREYFWQVYDSLGNDLTPGGPGVTSFTVATYQPDLRIGRRNNPATQSGNGLFNSTGSGQRVRLNLRGTRPGKAFFSIENDGDMLDSHKVRASPRKRRKFRFVRYMRLYPETSNITASVSRVGHIQSGVAPGGLVAYRVQAKGNGKRRARQTLSIAATSLEDSRGVDVGKSLLIAKPKR